MKIEITNEQKQAIVKASPDATFLDFLSNLEITSGEDLRDANELLHDLDDKLKNLEKLRKGITEPINMAKRNVDALFKPATTALKTGVAYLKNAILRWDQIRYTLPALSSANTDVEDTGLQYREKLIFEITNPELLPDEYVFTVPDIVKIQEQFDLLKENLDIPGVTVKTIKSLAVTKRS